MRRLAAAGLAVVLATAATGVSHANDFIRIGAIYPLTGPRAQAGLDAKAAIEIGEEIISRPHKGLEATLLGAGRNLPTAGDGQIQVIFADHQENASVAQGQALYLIGQTKVVALIGGGGWPSMRAATVAAEHHRIPFLVPDAIEPQITGRGFDWVFRTTPLAGDLTKAYAQFLTGLKAGGAKIDRIAVVSGTDARGGEVGRRFSDAAQAAGFAVDTIAYKPDSLDVTATVTLLRRKNPDAAIFECDAADASLFIKTMKTLDYKLPILIGDAGGFSDPTFVAADGNLAQGLISRSVWSVGDTDSPAAIVNALFKAKTGHDLDDTSARVLQGFLVLADAINRAGSSEPAAIQKALRETELKADQLIVGYDGVKFDATGQNTLAATFLTQLQGKQYITVWPAERAAGKLVLPYKAWQP
jgi:branched-chain amino acid transport system substrate-binding protein